MKFKKLIKILENMGSLKFLDEGLRKLHPLKGNYKFGENENINVSHNIVDELIKQIIQKGYHGENISANPLLNIGTNFGENNNWFTGLNIGKNNIGFNVGRKF